MKTAHARLLEKRRHERHRQRHVELHQALDELAADWVVHQPRGKVFSNSSIMELIQWSHVQTIEPEEP
jgi:hypothetical protein